MLYIIADDLTGATDTGVQFSTKGYKTDVIIYNEKTDNINIDNIKSDVIVIDSETRELDKKRAKDRIKKILKKINFKENDIIYKKIDSTLRGNIGIEIDVIMKDLKMDLCIFSPSFPENSRITKDGKLIVDNRLLGFTEYYEGNSIPEKASYIPNIINVQSNIKIKVIDLTILNKYNFNLKEITKQLDKNDKYILVIDSVNDEQLKNIILKSKEIDKKIIYAGSAGLANHLNLIYTNKNNQEKNNIDLSKNLLIVAASRRTIVDDQIDHIKNNFNIYDFKINVNDILNKFEKSIIENMYSLNQYIENNQKIIIRPNPIFKDEKEINILTKKYNISFRELQIKIKKYISKLIKEILDKNSNFNIFITGGDTAAGVCNELEIESLTIIDELLPGIPISKAKTNKYNNLNIITKAGGFGKSDSISKIIDKLI